MPLLSWNLIDFFIAFHVDRSISDFCPSAGRRIQTLFSSVIVCWKHCSIRKRGTNISLRCIRSTLASTRMKHKIHYGVFRTVFWTMSNQKWVFHFYWNFSPTFIVDHFWQIIVLHVGTNNVKNSAEEIADGISEIVKCIREKLPEVYIVLPVCLACFIFQCWI